MKHFVCRLLALGTAAVLLGCGSAALAAEEPAAIAVQLDGQELVFTDAVPQVKDERIFLPFRAIFEAMGAEVDYSAPDQTVTAKRDGTTVTMVLGGTIATVEKNGISDEITMDVAPYVDPETWRTYVPVRFAAQAFGCTVGWDQEAYTAIIVDTDKLLESVTEGRSFTYLEKYLAYSEKFSEGIWDMEIGFDGTISVMGAPMALNGFAAGTVADSTKMSMDMGMKLDMTGFIAAMQEMSAAMGITDTALSAEDQAILNALANEGIGIQMRADLDAGKLYMNMSGSVLESAGISSEAWYLMDMAALYGEMGVDYAALIQSSKSLDYEALVKSTLSGLELTDASSDYEMIRSIAEQIVSAVADDAFAADGSSRVAALVIPETEGAQGSIIFALTVEDDEVVGYSIDLAVTAVQDDTVIAIEMSISMDENDQMSAYAAMNMADVITMDLTMTGGYVPGTAVPVTEPPAGTVVIPFEDMAEL